MVLSVKYLPSDAYALSDAYVADTCKLRARGWCLHYFSEY